MADSGDHRLAAGSGGTGNTLGLKDPQILLAAAAAGHKDQIGPRVAVKPPDPFGDASLGLNALYQRINHEMEEETQHADALLKRILFLEGDPDMRPDAFEPGKTVQEMLRKDLDLEYLVRDHLAKGIALCEEHGDYVSRDVLVTQLADTEEDHTRWLEKQLRLIRMVGLENYQQSRMGEAEGTHAGV